MSVKEMLMEIYERKRRQGRPELRGWDLTEKGLSSKNADCLEASRSSQKLEKGAGGDDIAGRNLWICAINGSRCARSLLCAGIHGSRRVVACKIYGFWV